MTNVEKVIIALLVMAIMLFVILLATDNIQVIIVVGEKIKTGAERMNWKEVLKVAKKYYLKSARASFFVSKESPHKQGI